MQVEPFSIRSGAQHCDYLVTQRESHSRDHAYGYISPPGGHHTFDAQNRRGNPFAMHVDRFLKSVRANSQKQRDMTGNSRQNHLG